MSLVLQLLSRRSTDREADTASAPARLISLPGTSALVLDSPHSGTDYPADFGHACPMHELRQAEDTHVDALYAFAPQLGCAWIEALFPRSYLDVNRNLLEIDQDMLDAPWSGPVASDAASTSKIRLGKGLVWRCLDSGAPVYQRQLGVTEVQARIDSCWQPYHAAVAEAVRAAHARHGYSIHLNCHSMPAVASAFSTEFPGLAHADFVVGDRDGTAADARLSRLVCAHLAALGYSVSYNHPYKGVELLRRHGDPASQRHSIQLEINRRLYMDEETLAIAKPAFNKLVGHLRSLVELLLATDSRKLP